MIGDVKQLAKTLRVLANENRLQILCALMEGPKTVGTLCAGISNITQSALSQHLALLKAHGMVEDRRNGQSITYSIADQRLEEVLAVLKRHYCQPAQERGDSAIQTEP